jgi:hypothetical protein
MYNYLTVGCFGKCDNAYSFMVYCNMLISLFGSYSLS